MVKFIMKRLTLMIPLLIVVTFMTFMMTYLTNEDPAVTILHAQGTPNITQDLIAETKEKYGRNIKIGLLMPCSLNLERVISQGIQYLSVWGQRL